MFHADRVFSCLRHVGHCVTGIWMEYHCVLVVQIGPDFLLPIVAATMLGSNEFWKAMLDFCDSIISQKKRRKERGRARPYPY